MRYILAVVLLCVVCCTAYAVTQEIVQDSSDTSIQTINTEIRKLWQEIQSLDSRVEALEP